MTKTDLKLEKQKYDDLSKYISKVSAGNLIKETTEEQEKRIKRLLKPENYVEFFDFYFGINSGQDFADAPSSWFHQKSYEQIFANPKIIQQRRWFRGAAKSIHTNVGNTAHLKENKELRFGVLLGRTEDLAKKLLSNLQVQLDNNEKYIKDFGEQKSYGNWADGVFETSDGTYFKGIGLNQPIRGLNHNGRRPDFASMDDLEDRKAAKNIELTKENVRKLTGDLGKAGQRGRFRRIMPNNLIVKNGIIEGFAEKYKKSNNFHISTINLCDNDFNPTWHERYSKDECIEIVNDDDYHTSQREDFNNPVEEGKRIKEEWIKFKAVHGNKIHSGLIEWWDLSYTDDGDFKAGTLLSIENGKAHVLEVFNRQCNRAVAMAKHYEWQEKYNKKGMSIISFYDATASQKSVYEPEWLIASEDNNAVDVPFPDHASGDKHENIDAVLVSAFFSGLITFDDNLRDTDDMDKALDHILAFEKKCKTPDDILDCLMNSIRKGRLLFGYSKKEESNQKPHIGRRKTRRRV
jgi:phage terminase large subunit-like protein